MISSLVPIFFSVISVNMITKVRSVSLEKIESLIILLRGEKAIIDSELAKIYGIPTARLNQQVRRNKRRLSTGFYVSTHH